MMRCVLHCWVADGAAGAVADVGIHHGAPLGPAVRPGAASQVTQAPESHHDTAYMVTAGTACVSCGHHYLHIALLPRDSRVMPSHARVRPCIRSLSQYSASFYSLVATWIDLRVAVSCGRLLPEGGGAVIACLLFVPG